MSTDPFADTRFEGKSEASPEDIAAEMQFRRSVYRRLWETTPESDGKRSIVFNNGEELHKFPRRAMIELGLIDQKGLEYAGLEGHLGIEERYKSLMERCGWVKFERIPRADLSLEETYCVTLLVDPDKIDELDQPYIADLPPITIAVETIELMPAYKRLLGVSTEFKGERCVADPVRALTNYFSQGRAYDADETVNMLIDAGLAEWRSHNAVGTEGDRLFLMPLPVDTSVPPPSPTVTQPEEADLAVLLRSKRAELQRSLENSLETSGQLQAQIRDLQSQLAALEHEATTVATNSSNLGREIRTIDEQLQALAEIEQAERELAARKAQIRAAIAVAGSSK